uniref:Cytochrome c oxidase subunit I n=1 Tax=Lepidochelys olivacea TaxID=27788 RepID=B6GV37_LEPOA|nr:cytochrome c oxidase subunit I [Lepidochelys olivacea]
MINPLTLFYQPWKHRHPMPNLRGMSKNSKHSTQSINPRKTKPTKYSPKKWPNLWRHRHSPCFHHNLLHSYTNYNWKLWKLTCSTNNWSAKYSIPTYKWHKLLTSTSFTITTFSIIKNWSKRKYKLNSMSPISRKPSPRRCFCKPNYLLPPPSRCIFNFKSYQLYYHSNQYKIPCHITMPNTLICMIRTNYSRPTTTFATSTCCKYYYTTYKSKSKYNLLWSFKGKKPNPMPTPILILWTSWGMHPNPSKIRYDLPHRYLLCRKKKTIRLQWEWFEQWYPSVSWASSYELTTYSPVEWTWMHELTSHLQQWSLLFQQEWKYSADWPPYMVEWLNETPPYSEPWVSSFSLLLGDWQVLYWPTHHWMLCYMMLTMWWHISTTFYQWGPYLPSWQDLLTDSLFLQDIHFTKLEQKYISEWYLQVLTWPSSPNISWDWLEYHDDTHIIQTHTPYETPSHQSDLWFLWWQWLWWYLIIWEAFSSKPKNNNSKTYNHQRKMITRLPSPMSHMRKDQLTYKPKK